MEENPSVCFDVKDQLMMGFDHVVEDEVKADISLKLLDRHTRSNQMAYLILLLVTGSDNLMIQWYPHQYYFWI